MRLLIRHHNGACRKRAFNKPMVFNTPLSYKIIVNMASWLRTRSVHLTKCMGVQFQLRYLCRTIRLHSLLNFSEHFHTRSGPQRSFV